MLLSLLHKILNHRLHGFRVPLNTLAPFTRLQETLHKLLLQKLLLNLPSSLPRKLYTLYNLNIVQIYLFSLLHIPNTLCHYNKLISEISIKHFLRHQTYIKKQNNRTLVCQRCVWWTGRDLNPRLPRCQRGDHTKLIYPPMQSHASIIFPTVFEC